MEIKDLTESKINQFKLDRSFVEGTPIGRTTQVNNERFIVSELVSLVNLSYPVRVFYSYHLV